MIEGMNGKDLKVLRRIVEEDAFVALGRRIDVVFVRDLLR
jgi:hypothetical protein